MDAALTGRVGASTVVYVKDADSMIVSAAETDPTQTAAKSAAGDSRSPQSVPGVLDLTHRFYDELPELCLRWSADTAPDPRVVVINSQLAASLGLDPAALARPEGLGVLAGGAEPQNSIPVALGYAGHQFGNYSPRLGDGRALLLGELALDRGSIVDVHMKGSGRTPFARGGDGKATIGPMLREYLISEAMSALGVPTTRSLAVVATGESVYRDGLEPGAVLTRVAASHIRVGTFEYAIRLGGPELVRRLADHAIARHYPELQAHDDSYRAFLESVVDTQAYLIAKWMSIGFIHGVMNTDNMAISGEGIDYGPCAFMDAYDPSTVFSSIDHGGRYAFGNQVRVGAWNLARLAETLLERLDSDSEKAVTIATEIVNGFAIRFREHWLAEMSTKLGTGTHTGLPVDVGEQADSGGSTTIHDDLVTLMYDEHLDWTATFRGLSSWLRTATEDGPAYAIARQVEVLGRPNSALTEWASRWAGTLKDAESDFQMIADRMDTVNPIYIPRNHLVQHALDSATHGDLSPFKELNSVLSNPFTRRDGLDDYEGPAPDDFSESFQTFCGT